eukprot:716840-Alexandrium_andersonii.AAC.1
MLLRGGAPPALLPAAAGARGRRASFGGRRSVAYVDGTIEDEGLGDADEVDEVQRANMSSVIHALEGNGVEPATRLTYAPRLGEAPISEWMR